MTPLSVTLASLALSLIPTVIAIPARRAPHLASIIAPQAGSVQIFDAGTATFNFQFSDGERAEESTCSLFVANTTAQYTLASGITFYNSYDVNTTIQVSSDYIAAGSYTLVVEELYEGQIVNEVIQPIGFGSGTPPSTASASIVNPSQWSSTVLLPTPAGESSSSITAQSKTTAGDDGEDALPSIFAIVASLVSKAEAAEGSQSAS